MAHQEGERAKKIENPNMRGPLEANHGDRRYGREVGGGAEAVTYLISYAGHHAAGVVTVIGADVSASNFCEPPQDRVTLRNDLAYVLRDAFPVTPMHSLVIPYRHAPDYFSLTQEELVACDRLLRQMSEALKRADAAIAGFNIGVNIGSAAGQTVSHCHFHLIPRRTGDVENPRGGIRHIIPGKGDY